MAKVVETIQNLRGGTDIEPETGRELVVVDNQKEIVPAGEQPKEIVGANIAQVLEKAREKNINRNYLDLETAKAVMERIFQEDVLESTTNLTRHERDELVQAMLYYYYTRNPAIIVFAVSFMKMNRSLSERITNVLENLFNLPKIAEEGHIGRYGRFKSWVSGR